MALEAGRLPRTWTTLATLFIDSTEIAVLAVPEAKAVLFTSPEIVVEVASGKKLTVQAVGNATASVVYSATFRAHPEALF